MGMLKPFRLERGCQECVGFSTSFSELARACASTIMVSNIYLIGFLIRNVGT